MPEPRSNRREPHSPAEADTLKIPPYELDVDGRVRLQPMRAYRSVQQVSEAEASACIEHCRRLEAGEIEPELSAEKEARAARSRAQLAGALARMIDPRAVLSSPQRLAALQMLTGVSVRMDEQIGVEVLLAPIATYVHTCQLLANSYETEPSDSTKT